MTKCRRLQRYIRVDVVGEVLQRVSIQGRKCRIVLRQLKAIVVGVRIVFDLAVGDLRDVVESVAKRSQSMLPSSERTRLTVDRC